jgi:hypothetical protein
MTIYLKTSRLNAIDILNTRIGRVRLAKMCLFARVEIEFFFLEKGDGDLQSRDGLKNLSNLTFYYQGRYYACA